MKNSGSNMAHASVGQQTLRGLLQLGSSTLFTAGFRIVVVGVMARLLAPEDFGVVAISNIFVEFARLVTTSGLAQSLVHKRTLSEEEIRTAFTASLASGFLTMLGVIVAAPFIARFFELPALTNVLYVCSLIPPLIAVSMISSKLLERAHRFGPIARTEAMAYVAAQVCTGIPIAYFGGGVWALIIPQVISTLFTSLLLFRAQSHSLALYFGREEYRELMRLGTGFGLQRFANFAAQRGDYFVTGKLLGPLALGQYERSYVLMNLSNSLLAKALKTTLFPAFSRVAEDKERFAKAYLDSMSSAALITLPVSLACIVLADEIVETLLGQRWLDAATPFAILSLGIFARTCFKVAGSAANGLGLAYRNLVSQIIYAACVIVGAAIGSRWGINGVATSTLVAIFIVLLSFNHNVMRVVGIDWKAMARAIAPGLTSSLLLASAAWICVAYLRDAMVMPAVIRLLISGGVAGAVLLGATFGLPRLFLGRHVMGMLRRYIPDKKLLRRLYE
ncbi:lipopolysaccharide biosynthesis protein [Novosphingobium mangrovi (ex Hu et al. 2023)]|uniref:Lipopolysaccharide biosynthesis protein n=1 Tax=Novosphingobium mangrovi (ex Hu et al. 2023) TaxID=2930094 RepID=A0ABT0ACC8_9SPHN|nr:lipopolysaccharide biosynthesis protein [Novosphingobium mangrovi (ex Hu et al. 2023)]MCJ1960821.1 lipopolysaccharide biosynthesis protein [Novosphingobium mangrovi (ex Hu et al. 2023)]